MDLSTTYMGLALKNPVVPGASPLTADVDSVKKLADAGAAAVVLHSLFEEQLTHEQLELDHHTTHGTEFYSEMLSFYPEPDEYRLGPEAYLDHIRKCKSAVNIPVIASLNGVTVGGWTDYAQKMEEAGADALELNIYYVAADVKLDGEHVENLYLDILKAVKSVVNIPVAMKLSPYFSAMGGMARQLDKNGADGLVLFNRFYQPDIDLDELEVKPDLKLSSSDELRLPLRWVATLYSHIEASMAASSGVATGSDVLKSMMAGADCVQIASALLRDGPTRITSILEEMEAWMREREYESVEQMKGSLSQRSCPDPTAFERANYMKALSTYA